MVLAHCTSPLCDLSVCEVWSYYLLYFGSYATEKNPKLKFTKGNNSKNKWIELWFLYTALLHNVTYLCMKFQVISVTGVEKISGSTGIRTQGLRNTVPALYHWATEPHVDVPHIILPNTCTQLHSYTFASFCGIDQYTTYSTPPPYEDSSTNPSITQLSGLFTLGANVRGSEKISCSTGIRTKGLRNTVPALYHWATDPHVNLSHDISPNTCTLLHSYTFTSFCGIDQYTTLNLIHLKLCPGQDFMTHGQGDSSISP